MSTLILELIGLPCTYKVMMLNTLIVFWVEYIPKEIKTFIGNKNVKTNIFRIQALDSIMCRYFCVGFIDFMFWRKTLLINFLLILFHQITLKKWWHNSKLFHGRCLKMTERSSHETHNIYLNLGVALNDQQQFRLNKINIIK